MSRTQWVYMLHYDRPIGDTTRPRMWAQHYVGSFWDAARIGDHRDGTSRVAIVAAFHGQGIPFQVVRLRRGSKQLERRIKTNGHFARYCPACTPQPLDGLWVPVTPRRTRKQTRRADV